MRATRAVQLDLQRRGRAPRPASSQVGQRLGILRRQATRKRQSSDSGTTHCEIEVANDFPRNGPSGRYSQPWMSRADQSFSSTAPNTWSSARSTGTGPSLATPITKPSSSSMSSGGSGRSRPGRAARRAPDRRPARHHRPRPAVVADRHLQPVGQKRLGVGPEHQPDVAGVVERRVEVDVVGDVNGSSSSTSPSSPSERR